MQEGGNDRLHSFLAERGVPQDLSIENRYITLAADQHGPLLSPRPHQDCDRPCHICTGTFEACSLTSFAGTHRIVPFALQLTRLTAAKPA